MKLFLKKQKQSFLVFDEVIEKQIFRSKSLSKNEEEKEKVKKHSF
jgi:hypothetical protein